MKPFSLTAVLKYRKQLQDMAATRLLEAQHLRQQIFLQLQSANSEYELLINNLKNHQEAGIDLADLERYENRISWFSGHLEKVKAAFLEAEQKVEKERINVVKKSRDKQVLEKLKEKQNRAWKKHLDKKETSKLDEIAVLAYDRNTSD